MLQGYRVSCESTVAAKRVTHGESVNEYPKLTKIQGVKTCVDVIRTKTGPHRFSEECVGCNLERKSVGKICGNQSDFQVKR